MATNIGSFGLQLRLVANLIFPAGININTFTGDTDSLDVKELTVAQTEMGLNGDLLYWQNANPIEVAISVVPGSVDDTNLGLILEWDRVSKAKQAAGLTPKKNRCTLVVSYPDGSTDTYTGGIIVSGSYANSASSSGRIKTKVYNFVFQDKTSITI